MILFLSRKIFDAKVEFDYSIEKYLKKLFPPIECKQAAKPDK